MSAVVHNIPDMAGPLKSSVEEYLPYISFDFKASALITPKPILKNQPNWPHHRVEDEALLLL